MNRPHQGRCFFCCAHTHTHTHPIRSNELNKRKTDDDDGVFLFYILCAALLLLLPLPPLNGFGVRVRVFVQIRVVHSRCCAASISYIYLRKYAFSKCDPTTENGAFTFAVGFSGRLSRFLLCCTQTTAKSIHVYDLENSFALNCAIRHAAHALFIRVATRRERKEELIRWCVLSFAARIRGVARVITTRQHGSAQDQRVIYNGKAKVKPRI